MEQTNRASYCNEQRNLNKVIFNTKNIEVNQKLNAFIHTNIKEIIGTRSYLYYLQNIIFSAIGKNVLAVIGGDKNNVENVYEKFNYHICKLTRDTWKNSALSIKYYYILDGNLIEINTETNFVEKQTSKVVYFNEAGNEYSFDNFVSSEENFTALEVCQSIACYSQKELVLGGSVVYLHGPESSGKTHLVNAISNFYTSKDGKVYNTSANLFLRKYVEAVQKQSVFNFQDSILKNEVIIIDDIDDLIGKNGTLNELYKLILVAVKEKKYIVLTGKTLPNVLLEKNSLFREILSNAVALKLNSPKDALKTQIVMNYICDKNMNVPITIVRDLVVNLDCNVRELKNYVKKLAIVKSIKKFELNTNLALEILSDDVKKNENSKKVITNDDIIKVVAEYYNFSYQDLISKIKKEDVCRARSVAIYFLQKINSLNYQEIGRILNRNHSNIILGLKKIDILIKQDPKLPSELADLQSKFKNF